MTTTIKVNPKLVSGRLFDYSNFYRYDGKSGNAHIDKILHYNCGLYIVIKTQTQHLYIKYKCHFKENPYRFSKKQMVECVILGHLPNGEWEYLNYLAGTNPLDSKSDSTLIEVNLKPIIKPYDEYQICLPPNGCVKEMKIASDSDIKFMRIPAQMVLLGSSVSQFCNGSNHMGVPQYMYRKYGVGVATLGISGYHTFHHIPLMNELAKLQNVKKVICDLEHVHYAEYEKVQSLILQPDFHFKVINSACTNTCIDLSNKYSEIKSFLPSADKLCDMRHLNDGGIIEYSQMLYEDFIRTQQTTNI